MNFNPSETKQLEELVKKHKEKSNYYATDWQRTYEAFWILHFYEIHLKVKVSAGTLESVRPFQGFSIHSQ